MDDIDHYNHYNHYILSTIELRICPLFTFALAPAKLTYCAPCAATSLLNARKRNARIRPLRNPRGQFLLTLQRRRSITASVTIVARRIGLPNSKSARSTRMRRTSEGKKMKKHKNIKMLYLQNITYHNNAYTPYKCLVIYAVIAGNARP